MEFRLGISEKVEPAKILIDRQHRVGRLEPAARLAPAEDADEEHLQAPVTRMTVAQAPDRIVARSCSDRGDAILVAGECDRAEGAGKRSGSSHEASMGRCGVGIGSSERLINLLDRLLDPNAVFFVLVPFRREQENSSRFRRGETDQAIKGLLPYFGGWILYALRPGIQSQTAACVPRSHGRGANECRRPIRGGSPPEARGGRCDRVLEVSERRNPVRRIE